MPQKCDPARVVYITYIITEKCIKAISYEMNRQEYGCVKIYCANVKIIYLILANTTSDCSKLANMIKLENMLSIFLNLECARHFIKLGSCNKDLNVIDIYSHFSRVIDICSNF